VKNHNILEIGENALLIGSGVGSVASVLSQQALYTVAPLSMLVMVSLANRRRFEHTVNKNAADAMARFDHQITQELTTLRQQVVSLPNRLEVAGIKKTVLQKQQEGLADFGKAIEARLAKLEQMGPEQLQRDLSQLQDHHHQMTEQLHGLSSYLHRVAAAGKMDAIEKSISELRQEVEQTQNRLQTLANEPRNNININAFQDQINHLNRRLNNLPPPFDATALRQDMDAVIKLVGDLVPKRDLSRVMFEMEQLRQQFIGIEQTVASLRISAPILRKQMDSLSSRVEAIQGVGNLSVDASEFEAQLADVRARLSEFSTELTALERRFEQGPTLPEVLSLPLFDEDLDLSDPEQLESMLGLFSQDLDEIDLENLDNLLEPTADSQALQNQGSNGAVSKAGFGNSRVLQEQLQRLADRLHSLEQRQRPSAQVGMPSPVGDLMFAMPAPDREDLPTLLEQVLSEAQREVVVVFPSPARCQFSDRLMNAIQAFLQRKGVLKLGFGFLDAHQGQNRYLDAQWTTDLVAQKLLVRTLNQLAQLKQSHPRQFAFKVLGANENFILCDRSLAVLGVQTLSVASSAFPQLEVGLRTTQSGVLQQLQHRFERPKINLEDPKPLFQRAITRHELGDRPGAIQDLNRVMQLNPQDDAAYNYRGVVHFELGDIPGAIADFEQALRLNARNLPARCNHGHALIQVNELERALRDFDAAIAQDANAITAYFHRGLTRSRMEDRAGAIADYSRVIELVPDAAIAYFYRSLAYTRLNQINLAIQDLQQAIPRFDQQANRTYSEKARTMLTRLQQFSATGATKAAKVNPPARSETSPVADRPAEISVAQPASEDAPPQDPPLSRPSQPRVPEAGTITATRKTGFQSFVPAGAQPVNLKSESQSDDEEDTVVFAYLHPSQPTSAASSAEDFSIPEADQMGAEVGDFFEPADFPEASDLPGAAEFMTSRPASTIAPDATSTTAPRTGQAEPAELAPLESEIAPFQIQTDCPPKESGISPGSVPESAIATPANTESAEIVESGWDWDEVSPAEPQLEADIFSNLGVAEPEDNSDQTGDRTSAPQTAPLQPSEELATEAVMTAAADNPLASMTLGELFGLDESETSPSAGNIPDRASPSPDDDLASLADPDWSITTASNANIAIHDSGTSQRDLGQVTLENAFYGVEASPETGTRYRPKTLDQGFLGSRARQPSQTQASKSASVPQTGPEATTLETSQDPVGEDESISPAGAEANDDSMTLGDMGSLFGP